MKHHLTIGIDEVGRGALAGPVVLAAVQLHGRIRWTHPQLGRIRDSKKLTPKRREAWFRYLAVHPRLRWRIARVGPRVIDRINITRAADRGALRLCHHLVIARSTAENGTTKQSRWPRRRLLGSARNGMPAGRRWRVFLDGGLKLPTHIPHRTIVKGDERLPLIAAASIMAKVWRDRLMRRRSRDFPAYGFERHKGYATKLHRRALRRYGPLPIHRKTFLTRLL